MKTLLTVVNLFAVGTVLADISFTGPGSDLADRNNWDGGNLPSASDVVLFKNYYPDGGFTLSGNVAFGLTKFSRADAVLDLCGYDYTASSSFQVVLNTYVRGGGALTYEDILIYKDQTLTVGGSTTVMKSTGNCAPFKRANSTLHVTDGATYLPGGNSFGLGGDKTGGGKMYFDKGAVFDCRKMTAEYNLAVINNKTAASGFELVFDASTFYFYSVNIGVKPSGDFCGNPTNFLFAFRNGSTVKGVRTDVATKDCYGWRFGHGGLGSTSNRLEITDSSFEIEGKNGGLSFGGRFDTFCASNATVSIPKGIDLDGCCGNRFIMKDSAINADISLAEGAVSNSIMAAGCSAFAASLTVGGCDNTVYLSNDVATAVSLSGTNNTAVIASANALKHTIEGAGCSLTYTASAICNAALPFSGNAADKTFVLAGGQYQSAKVEFEGANNSIVLRDGGIIQYGTGETALKDQFNFKPNASSNYVIRIEDEGMISLRGQVNFNGNCTDGDASGCYKYDWTNCPNCAVEFSGRHPQMVCSDYKKNYPLFGLGTSDEEPLVDPVVFRFVIPDGGFQEAPLRNETEGFRMYIYGNQPFAFRLADGYEPKEKIRIPFLYDADNFSSNVARGGLPMTAERVAKLNENAIFELNPEKYRGRIVYDSAAKSLVAEIRPIKGLCLIVR